MRAAERRWVNTQWEAERGTWQIDYNNCLALVRAPVEDVALCLKRRTVRWEPDVLGAEVEVADNALFLFRLRGHVWTEALHRKDNYRWVGPVSRRLGTRAIFYCVSDTCGSTGYDLYEAGRLVERFAATEGAAWRFSSKRRPRAGGRIKDMWGWADRFFREQDALEPFIDFGYFFNHREVRPGERAILQNPGFVQRSLPEDVVTRPGLERVDYLVLR
jgi:hypothetical protein